MSINKHEIYRIVRHNPSLIKYLYDNNSNKGYVTRLLNNLVPFKIGIEFELFGSIVHHKYGITSDPRRNKVVRSDERNNLFNKLTKELNITSYNEDYMFYPDSKELNGELNEIRICIEKYNQLTGLFKSCELLKSYCKIPKEKGGIHIHVDFSSIIKNYENADKYAKSWFSNPKVQSRILEIFGGYKGSYNKPGCGLRSKGKYVNISRLSTIEFRIGTLTFDYSKIVYYIIELSKLVKQCKYDFLNKIEAYKIPDKPELSESIHINDLRLSTDDIIFDEHASNSVIDTADLIEQRLENLERLVSNRVYLNTTNNNWSTSYSDSYYTSSC